MSAEQVEDLGRPDDIALYKFIIENDNGVGCEVESDWQISNYYEYDLGDINDLCALIYPELDITFGGFPVECIDNPSGILKGLFEWQFYIITKDKNNNISEPSEAYTLVPESYQDTINKCGVFEEGETVYVRLNIATRYTLDNTDCTEDSWMENCNAYYQLPTWYDDELYDENLYIYITEEIWDLLPKPCVIRWRGLIFEVPTAAVEKTNWKNSWDGSNFDMPTILNINPNQCLEYKNQSNTNYDDCVQECMDNQDNPSACYEYEIDTDNSIILSSNCYLHLRMNDYAANTTVLDSSDYDNNATANRNTADMVVNPSVSDREEGVVNYSLYFNGIDDYIDCIPYTDTLPAIELPYALIGSGDDYNNNPSGWPSDYKYWDGEDPSLYIPPDEEDNYPYDHRYNNTNSFTYCFWAKIKNKNGEITLITDGIYEGWKLTYDTTDQTVKLINNTTNTIILEQSNIKQNIWTHFILIIDNENPSDITTCTLLINNNISAASVNSAELTNSDFNIIIGNDTSHDTFFNGWMDDIRVYKTILTNEALTRIYNDGYGSEEEDFIVYTETEIYCDRLDENRDRFLDCVRDCDSVKDGDTCFSHYNCDICSDYKEWWLIKSPSYDNPSFFCSDYDNPSDIYDRICVYRNSKLAWLDFYQPFYYDCLDTKKPNIYVEQDNPYRFRNTNTYDYAENFLFGHCSYDNYILCPEGKIRYTFSHVCISFSVFQGSATFSINDGRIMTENTFFEWCIDTRNLKEYSDCVNYYTNYEPSMSIQVTDVSADADYRINVSLKCYQSCIDDFDNGRAVLSSICADDPTLDCCNPDTPSQLVYVRTEGIPEGGAYFAYKNICRYVNESTGIDVRFLPSDAILLESVSDDYENCQDCCCDNDWLCHKNLITGGKWCSQTETRDPEIVISGVYNTEENCNSNCGGCEFCPASAETPQYISVTFGSAGWTYCDTCWQLAVWDAEWINIPVIAGGTYILEKTDDDNCIWEYTESINTTNIYHTQFSGCANEQQRFEYVTLRMRLTRSTSNGLLMIEMIEADETTRTYCSYNANLTDDVDCIEGTYNASPLAQPCYGEPLHTVGTVTISEL